MARLKLNHAVCAQAVNLPDPSVALTESKVSLYVHLPWCERKCPYCDFNSHRAPNEIPHQRYIDALLKDLQSERQRAQHYGICPQTLSSVFLGGGTPSLFSPDSIAELLSGLDQLIPFSNDCEITMEANPGSIETGRLTGFRRAGVNRLSLGVQSLSDEHLRALGRVHNASQARAAVAEALHAGFDKTNVDLMYALPNQTVQQSLDDLDAVLSFGVRHISRYELTIEPNTVFARHRPSGLPTERQTLTMCEQGNALLADKGLGRYEISAYASDADHQCRHNMHYWRYGDYFGIGAGAHGKLTVAPSKLVVRTSKWRSPTSYINACLSDQSTSPADRAPPRSLTDDSERLISTPATERIEQSDLAAQVDEFLLNALRLIDGISLSLWQKVTGLTKDLLLDATRDLINQNKLNFSDNCISIHPDSVRITDALIVQISANIERLTGGAHSHCSSAGSRRFANGDVSLQPIFSHIDRIDKNKPKYQ